MSQNPKVFEIKTTFNAIIEARSEEEAVQIHMEKIKNMGVNNNLLEMFQNSNAKTKICEDETLVDDPDYSYKEHYKHDIGAEISGVLGNGA